MRIKLIHKIKYKSGIYEGNIGTFYILSNKVKSQKNTEYYEYSNIP